jgi:hypothetical protein
MCFAVIGAVLLFPFLLRWMIHRKYLKKERLRQLMAFVDEVVILPIDPNNRPVKAHFRLMDDLQISTVQVYELVDAIEHRTGTILRSDTAVGHGIGTVGELLAALEERGFF